jgi:hypothetical protein
MLQATSPQTAIAVTGGALVRGRGFLWHELAVHIIAIAPFGNRRVLARGLRVA